MRKFMSALLSKETVDKSVSFRCDKCNGPPDSITYSQSNDSDSILIKARCHGEDGVIVIPSLDFYLKPNITLFGNESDYSLEVEKSRDL